MNRDENQQVVKRTGQPTPADWPTFELGAILDINGCLFKIVKIRPYRMEIRPMKGRIGRAK